MERWGMKKIKKKLGSEEEGKDLKRKYGEGNTKETRFRKERKRELQR